MKLAKTEKAITSYLQEAINGNIYVKTDNSLTNAQMVGYGLSYYLTALLKKLKDSNIESKWIDGVEWKSFDLFSPNKLKGSGNLWWGFRKDKSAKTFPEDFYCELELDNSKKKPTILYLFRFQVDGKDYKLKS